MNNVDIEILNASVHILEEGWQEVKITCNGEERTIEFATEETTRNFNVFFADEKNEKIAKEIGFEITEDFIKKFQWAWSNYSERTFR